MISALGLGLAAGLFAGVHCFGMCGPLAALSGPRFRSGLHFWMAKTVSYLVLGTWLQLALLGFFPDQGLGIRDFLARATGVLLAFQGIRLCLGPSSAWAPLRKLPGSEQNEAPPAILAWVLGSLAGLLPCGFSWSALALATSFPDPLEGMAFLLAFSLGTSPALALARASMQSRGSPKRRRAWLGLFWLGLGLWLSWFGAGHSRSPPAPPESNFVPCVLPPDAARSRELSMPKAQSLGPSAATSSSN